MIMLTDGTTRTLRLYAHGGALGIAELADTGELLFEPLPRVRTHRNQDKSGRYRWYNDYRLPARYESQAITVHLQGNDEDMARKLNRTENLRPIPPGDPDFERLSSRRLFSRRDAAESINRHLDDTMWLGRAHSIGHVRQQLNLIGFALCVKPSRSTGTGASVPKRSPRDRTPTGHARAPNTPSQHSLGGDAEPTR